MILSLLTISNSKSGMKWKTLLVLTTPVTTLTLKAIETTELDIISELDSIIEQILSTGITSLVAFVIM